MPVCYTAIDIKRTERGPDIKFFKKVGSAINTALIEDIGNQVQYFRIQALSLTANEKTCIRAKRYRICACAALTQ